MKSIIIFLAISLIANFFLLSEVYGEPIVYDDNYYIERFVGGLNYPTSMDFIGDDILILEKNTGKVIRIKSNGIMYDEPVLDVPVRSNFYSGLLGITTLSDRVFLYYTESESGSDSNEPGPNAKNRVYQYNWDGEKLTNPVLIKELIAQQGDDHHGGAITKGQNDEIYFVIGDQNQSGIFENVVDNPCYKIDFVNVECSSEIIYETSSVFKIHTQEKNRVELFAMGIRNSFGLAVDPVTGYLWDTENGKNHYDEINLVKPRFNSGWNNVMGPSDRQNPDDPVSQTIPQPFRDFIYSEPEFSWYDPVGPTAITFPNSISFEKYSDWLFVGDYHHGRIYKFQLNSDRTGFIFSDQRLSDLVLDELNDKVEKILFAKQFPTVTDIEFRSDAMYVVSIADGSIYKIYAKEPVTPFKQYQNGLTHKKIFCKQGFMPIMKNSGYINCANPKTALTLMHEIGWRINHSDMPIINLANQDLSELSFEHVHLTNSDLRNSNFTTTNITNANFTGANLSDVDLSDKDLTKTILTGADLSNSILTGVDLSGKDLSGTILTGTDLTNVVLSGAVMKDADLSNSILTGVDLSGKDLSGTILTGANLSNSILTGVDLSGKDLSIAILTGADLSNSILTGVDLSGKDLSGITLKDTNLAGVKLEMAYMNNANMAGADLSFNNLVGIKLIDANLSHAILSGADLTNAKLRNTNLSAAEMIGVKLIDADLTNANLTGANLHMADLTGANLDGVTINDASLSCIGHEICKN